MPTIQDIATLIGGGFDKGLALMLAELGVIRSEVPDASGQIDQFAAWLAQKTAGQFDAAHLVAIAAQVVALFSGKGWAPPNPGSIAGA